MLRVVMYSNRELLADTAFSDVSAGTFADRCGSQDVRLPIYLPVQRR
jgi:hypothetical protein